MPSPIISVEGVSKTFPGVRALSDVRFELMPGEVHALMGENGAGKSTLMKILAGVYRKDSGQILYNGASVDFSGPREAQHAGIGIIHQELQLMNHLTVAQNIFIGREPKRAFGLLLDEDKLNREAAALLDSPQPDHRSAHRRRRPDGRQAADGGDRQVVLPQLARAHHGRADGGAQQRRDRRAVQDDPRSQEPRRRESFTSRTRSTS